MNLGTPILGMLLVIRRPEDRIGWMFLGVGLVLGMTQFLGAYATHALLVQPASVAGGNLAAWIQTVLSPLPLIALIFLFLWFPTGDVPSSRWNLVVRFTVVMGIVSVLVSLALATASWNDPFSNADLGHGIGAATLVAFFLLGLGITPLLIVASLACSLTRFRHSRGDERLQLRDRPAGHGRPPGRGPRYARRSKRSGPGHDRHRNTPDPGDRGTRDRRFVVNLRRETPAGGDGDWGEARWRTQTA